MPRLNLTCLLVVLVFTDKGAAITWAHTKDIMDRLSVSCQREIEMGLFGRTEALTYKDVCGMIENCYTPFSTLNLFGCNDDDFDQLEKYCCEGSPSLAQKVKGILNNSPKKRKDKVLTNPTSVNVHLPDANVCEQMKWNEEHKGWHLSFPDSTKKVYDNNKDYYCRAFSSLPQKVKDIMKHSPYRCNKVAVQILSPHLSDANKTICTKTGGSIIKVFLLDAGCTKKFYDDIQNHYCMTSPTLPPTIKNLLENRTLNCNETARQIFAHYQNETYDNICKAIKTNILITEVLMGAGCTKKFYDDIKNHYCMTSPSLPPTVEKILEDRTLNCNETARQIFSNYRNDTYDNICKAMKTNDSIIEDLLYAGCSKKFYDDIKNHYCMTSPSLPQTVENILEDGTLNCYKTALQIFSKYQNDTYDNICKAMKTNNSIKEDLSHAGCTKKFYGDITDHYCTASSMFLTLVTVVFCATAHLVTLIGL